MPCAEAAPFLPCPAARVSPASGMCARKAVPLCRRKRAAGRCSATRRRERIVGNTRFDDAVATDCWSLDRHPNKATVGTANDRPPVQPDPYNIPFRSLRSPKVTNLLVAGRCPSASRGGVDVRRRLEERGAGPLRR
jgi:hypothetical protein